MSGPDQIARKDLEVGDVIGKGSFGQVFKGSWHGREVAIKLVSVESPRLEADFENETALMAKCQDERIVQLFGVCKEAGFFAIVLEWMDKGSLYHLLKDKEIELPWITTRLSLAEDIAMGIAYLHDQHSIVHRDLKSPNVLITSDPQRRFRAKISDFGLSKIKLMSTTKTSSPIIGTLRWLAPEVIEGKAHSKESDVYALGLLLWEIITREIPYYQTSNEMLIMGWITNGKLVEIPDNAPQWYHDILMSCWPKEPKERPSAAKIVINLKEGMSDKIILSHLIQPATEVPKEIDRQPTSPQLIDRVTKVYPPLDTLATSPQLATHAPLRQWKVRKELLDRLSKEPLNPGQWYKKCELLPSDPEIDFVTKLFHVSKPFGFAIGRIFAVYNEAHRTSFESELSNMEQEAKKFLPRWQQDALKVERSKVIKRWMEFTHPFFPVEIIHNGVKVQLQCARVLPLWHGTSAEKCDSICGSGFTYFGKHNLSLEQKNESTDIGWFGSGIYFTNSARYASMYARGHLLLSWVSMREPYPVVSDVPHPKKCTDMSLLEGKGAFENYNAHHIPVASTNPDDLKWLTYFPCYKGQEPDCDELVVFQKAQTLPAFWIELAVDSPSSFAFGYSYAACAVACQAGNLDQLKVWYGEDPKRLKDRGDDGETYLFAAARANQLKILEWLYQKDHSLISTVREDGSTALHVAAHEGHRAAVQWFVDKNPALLDQPNKAKLTPIHFGAYADKLKDLGFPLTKIKALCPTLLFELAKRPCTRSLAFLIEQGVDFKAKNSFQQTLVHLAAEAGQEENLRYLESIGLGFNEKDRSGRTPLFLAVIQGHRSVVIYILQRNIQIDEIAVEGDTVAHVAAFYGHTPILDDILKRAQQINKLQKLLTMQDLDGKTVLHKATWGSPKPDVVELLLDKGADPNCKNKFFFTPLHWAGKHGHLESAKLLLAKGARLDAFNFNGDFPLTLAIRFGQDELARLFLGTSKKAIPTGPLPKDVEGYYLKSLLEARKSGDIEDQLFYLEKLSDHYIQNKNFLQGAKILNCAFAILKQDSSSYREYLFARLERIEELFLSSKGIKLPSDKRDYLKSLRAKLLEARLSIKKNLTTTSVAETVSHLSGDYQSHLQILIEDAIKLLGPPPSTWAAIGLGAMAKKEMVPYSGVQFAFLIESEGSKDYFHLLSELLELRIVNMGETPFPIFGQAEASPLVSGFGIKERALSPLGRPGEYQLIGTTLQLVEFQNPPWIDHHLKLANALKTTCLITGNRDLYEKYTKKVNDEELSLGKLFGVAKESKLAAAIFSTFFTKTPSLSLFDPAQPFDLYQRLHRPFEELLDGLAHSFQLKELSTLDRLIALEKKGIISPKAVTNLNNAFLEILKLRVETQFFYQDQIELFYQDTDPKNPRQIYLSAPTMAKIKEIFKVLVAFHAMVKEFYTTKKKNVLKEFNL